MITVDVKLEGLYALFAEEAKAFSGYIFAVDRNNRFLSYPSKNLARVHIQDDSPQTLSYITSAQMLKRDPAFAETHKHLRQLLEKERKGYRTSKEIKALTQSEVELIESRDSFYISTVGENGWPYVQHRGGPKGFLKVLDDTTLAVADFRGNMQYISAGNINAGHKAALILMDYPTRQRLKIWATAEILDIEAHPELFNKTMNPNYRASAERLITFKIEAYDWNCQQHITPRYTKDEWNARQTKDAH